MKITIETIRHDQQRYETVGDWHYDQDGNLYISVSKMSDWRYEALVIVHELVEVLLCRQAGVSQAAVDNFDIQFEKNRPEGCMDEPGDSPDSPYRVQHCIATGVERVLAAVLGVGWADYESEINSL